jgi:hypothetical protein
MIQNSDAKWTYQRTADSRHLGPSHLDYFVMEATGSMAELLRYSSGLEIACTGGAQIQRS